ncbi:MAG: AAA family ATPase [Chitinophagales bacterium]
MELLYIWIKEYNNIKEEGFNFSPRYWFKFDKNTNTLTCEKRKPELADIFNNTEEEKKKKYAKIVNVTAIVGENGTGKSSLLDFLMLSNKHEYPSILLFSNEKNNLIFSTLNENIIKPTNCQMMFNCNNMSHNILSNKIIFYSPIIDFRNSINLGAKNKAADRGRQFSEKSEKLSQIFDISSNTLLYKEELSLHIVKDVERQLNVILYADKNEKLKDEFNKISIPKKCKVKFAHITGTNITHGERKFVVNTENVINKIIKNNPDYGAIYQNILYNRSLFNEYNKSLGNKDLVYLMENDIRPSIFKPKIENNKIVIDDKGEIQKEEDVLEQETKELNKCIQELIGVLNENIQTVNFEDTQNENNFRKSQSIEFNFETTKKILEFYLNYINAWKNISHQFYDFLQFDWRDMSSGEKAFLNLYSRLWDAKKQIEQKEKEREEKDKSKFLYLLIDEGEMGFHPKWQKAYLKRLIDFVKVAFEGKKIQIIMTSHSPFLVSDLPKENVIFLRKDDDGNCEVAEPNFKRTFAENIHTLLANSFFMENGLVGEFAREKILGIKKKLDDAKYILEEDEKEYFEAVIESIGEPILRHIFQKKLREKVKGNVKPPEVQKGKLEEKIDKVLTEMEKLQKELDSLKEFNDFKKKKNEEAE